MRSCSHRSLDTGWLLPADPGLGHRVAPPSCCPWLQMRGGSSRLPPWPRTRGSSFWPFLCCRSLALLATAPDLRRGVTPLGRHPLGMGSSKLKPLTLDVGYLLSATHSVPVTATMPARQPKTGGSWWRGLTECGPLEKGMANHFSILALRTP